MRKIITAAVLAFLVTTAVGCPKQNTTSPPPAPVADCKLLANGQCDQTDVNSYRVLRDVNVFLQDIRDGVTSGKLTLTAAQKATFNTLAASSNALDVTWQAYHNGQSNDAAGLAAATNKLNNDLAAAQSQIVVVKP